ncbi:hypothetical protein HRI_000417400 [Hibiscus trionum]|uniref:Uncharacterized protein n=1 Tax=Hibiscus trionum TaxID=183268 RepID=A0A9W7H0K0_HIBTR|nr:hypothetical protein HRI_000417400 [Hibiscus trionum]
MVLPPSRHIYRQRHLSSNSVAGVKTNTAWILPHNPENQTKLLFETDLALLTLYPKVRLRCREATVEVVRAWEDKGMLDPGR